MGKSIWKYQISIQGRSTILVPEGAKFLHVDQQDATRHMLCLWAEVEGVALQEPRVFHVIGTGYAFPEVDLDYIGTVLMYGGQLVWHVYVETMEEPF